jgi:hypothetical protein
MKTCLVELLAILGLGLWVEGAFDNLKVAAAYGFVYKKIINEKKTWWVGHLASWGFGLWVVGLFTIRGFDPRSSINC